MHNDEHGNLIIAVEPHHLHCFTSHPWGWVYPQVVKLEREGWEICYPEKLSILGNIVPARRHKNIWCSGKMTGDYSNCVDTEPGVYKLENASGHFEWTTILCS